MQHRPDRGRIIVVNFEMGRAVPPEMTKPRRPCVVVQNNALQRGHLVTVVPLSSSEPEAETPYTHLMHHLSFRDWPLEWDGQGTPRYAQCEYVATVSLDRCNDPHRKVQGNRRYVKVKAAKQDIEAIDRCVMWALGIDPQEICLTPKGKGPTRGPYGHPWQLAVALQGDQPEGWI